MRINRFDTKAYVISAEGEAEALKYFNERAKKMEASYKSKVKTSLDYRYTPLLVVGAIKRDKDGKGTLIEGMENTFHIGLRDGCFYIFGKKGFADSAKGTLIKSHDINLERVDLLLDIATLSPKALNTLGMLLDRGTLNFEELDIPTQTAAKELNGRKYADIYRPVDREGDLTKAVKEIFEMTPVTPIYKISPKLPTPRFTDSSYNLSPHLKITEYIEDDVELEKVVHAPDKLMYILGTLFNCKLTIKRITYMPYIECTFAWEGKQSSQIKYIACKKNDQPKKYLHAKKLKVITIGTKGHALKAMPFEDVAINFSNVAGMSAVKERLKEGIIYPIAHPELSEEYGSEGGGGVLLYGPPGCGKSFLMKATVGEAGVNFYSIQIQDIVGGDISGGAEKLDQAFMEAREGSPSILFFDEIEALSGSRGDAQSSGEHMLVNQFLVNMEGVGATMENVLIVGATNAPWDMDPALRRSGRFTTQILIPPPDLDGRKALLKVHTKGRPLAEDVDFDKLAEITENYSSADITAICEEAAKIPWRESVHGAEKRTIGHRDFIEIINDRESSLLPWLRLAEKALRDSGEADLFPELAEYVFKRAGGIEMASQPTMTFKDVGGLDEVKEEIKNKVVYPLKHPELAEEYGRTVGGGILLYGAPGCGKTYIARATAGECGASFFNVTMTDLLSPEDGVTEKRLHAVFERAKRNTPAIIFFDEIDAVAGTRGAGEGGTERRLINQFLIEMDGFNKSEGVVILAATNAPWDIDPALRRAGRFSDQIFLPPPDQESRLQIFNIHKGDRPMAENVDFTKIAQMTEDYSSADISLIVDEAAKIPWKESMDTGEKRAIGMDDFREVLKERKPSITAWLKQAEKQLRESGEADVFPGLANYVMQRAGGLDAVSKPTLKFENVGGLEDVKESIRKKIVYPLLHPEVSAEYGKEVGGGLLLYGPPGCGKTFMARATAGECGAMFFNVKITDLISPVEGETERKLHSIFERASRNTPSIIFFDEIDAVAGQRSAAGSGSTRRLVNQFLTEMDGFERREGVFILAATNAPWDIDPALRRPGRFADQIFLPPPDESGREAMFKIHTKGKPIDTDVSFSELSQMTDGYSSADVAQICKEAADIPWSESMETGEKRKIRLSDFKTSISKRKPSITAWIKQAEKQLKGSGEENVYPGLSAYVMKRTGGLDAVAAPSINFSNVAGLEDVKEEIRNKIVYPLQHPELAQKYGRTVGGGMLLYGPPGCGKTFIARATAGECGAQFFNVKATDLMSNVEGETESRLHSIFERASRNTPSIIFFDEIDAVAGQRTSSGAGAERRLINQFLVEMDGFERRDGVVVLAATNAPWDIDPALRRPGRLSDLIFLPPPDFESRKSMFKLDCKKLPVEEDADWDLLSNMTSGFSAADINHVCEEAAKIPWKESLKTGITRKINTDDLKGTVEATVSSLGPWFIQAENQIVKSGEQASYPKMMLTLNEYGPSAKAKNANQPQSVQSSAPPQSQTIPAVDPTKPTHDTAPNVAPVEKAARQEASPETPQTPAVETIDAATTLADSQKPASDVKIQLNIDATPAKEKTPPSPLEALKKEKEQMEFMVGDLKQRHDAGELDDEIFHELSKEYTKKLIELDAKIRFSKE